MNQPARLLTGRFVLVVASGLCYFTALAMLNPVLPDYIEKSMGLGSIAVGIGVGAFALGAVLLRPLAGWVGDLMGRRVLIVGGALIVSCSTITYGLIHHLWFLVLARIATGFGEAGFFVGAATMITDLAPIERRGEAVSYWSVAVYGGLSIGPVVGSILHGHTHYGSVWVVSAALSMSAALIGLLTVEVPRDVPATRPKHLLHRAAIPPGTVLFLGLISLAGFTAFIPLYVDDLNVSAGAVFALYGVLILVVRIFGARLPDQLGGRTTASLALALITVGIGTVAVWQTVPGLVVGTIVFAAGMSLMYPALLLLALHGVSDAERASVVGTFSTFFDASQGLGAFICGTVVAAMGGRDSGAFLAGAVCAFGGLVVLRARGATRTAPATA